MKTAPRKPQGKSARPSKKPFDATAQADGTRIAQSPAVISDQDLKNLAAKTCETLSRQVNFDKLAEWNLHMMMERLAIQIESAMREQNLTIFGLARKLEWTPERVLRWLDGTATDLNKDNTREPDLRDLVQLGAALGQQFVDFEICKQ